MPQSFVSLNCHIIFSTKNREPLIEPAFTARLFEYMGGVCRGQKNLLLAAGGTRDHVHLLISLHKQRSVSELVRDIKSNSSGWVHGEFSKLRGFAWQTGYGAFSVSYSYLGKVKAYLAGQQEYHRVRTFQDEFLAFLRRHHIEYDERCIWE